MTPPEALVVGPLTRTDLVKYQGASGDFNPIHHDEPFATSVGLPAPLSLGMLQAGLMATWATNWLGASSVRRFKVRFAAQVFPGDTVSCSGRVEREYTVDRDGRPVAEGGDGAPMVDLELFCHKQDGTLAVRGWATFVVGESS
jgi:acyl dehydratase